MNKTGSVRGAPCGQEAVRQNVCLELSELVSLDVSELASLELTKFVTSAVRNSAPRSETRVF
jgi:hypothetical protein